MPAGFTQQERQRITEQLLAAGERLFTTQGLRKTALEELTSAAGIAKSSFYAFFDSKEALYLELMLRQAPELQARLLRALGEAASTADALRGFLRGAIDVLHTNPFYRRLVTHPDELAAVSRRLPPERLAEVNQPITTPITEFLTAAQQRGELPGTDPAVLLGVLRAVLLLPLHADQFDPADYPAVVDLLIDTVAIGLTSAENLTNEGEPGL
ncbi:TetR/AcrR family transcriptional regulator [Goodfellowiella coeruleoviolacea]|uniref:Transcriptional regulator, TetR family n=1 Tax=Goodfellowiella coeruleoviolacea TaxID=334858 RepID=A0AAE3KGC4_9PSEU|nr:TetR/AcrR family transcriptional regulator [Goodfellowiella coeruleoviolacea]MCP2165712.1 transcriptional regulator, TetR family [Goodfellowiella coeruleoviolacea]